MHQVTTAHITDTAALVSSAAGSVLVIRQRVRVDDLIHALQKIRDREEDDQQ
jgi:hypothetical protein